MDLSLFKDYDIRGTYPDQLNADTVKFIGRAIVEYFKPKRVAVARDMRLSGKELSDALIWALRNLGVAVDDAGQIGTEIAYFLAGTRDADLVIMISASHNPPQYNGLKIVKKGPVGVSRDSGLFAIRDLVRQDPLAPANNPAPVAPLEVWSQWKEKVLSLVDTSVLQPLSVVADAGNGMAGKLVPIVFDGLPITLTPLYFELDGSFPHHVPNPLIETNNTDLVNKVKEIGADVGLAFDGDADRVFFIDDRGRFVSGTVMTAMMAKKLLQKYPGAYILYSAVCGRIVPETVARYGGKSQRVRVGHSYMKNYMRQYRAIFGGEHSGHYYHRDFFNSETGVGTALMVLELISHDGRKFSDIVDEFAKYPESGEINFSVPDGETAIGTIRQAFTDAKSVDELDGLSVWYDEWWFNIRSSHTEPLIRLNVEAATQTLLDQKTNELIRRIESLGGKKK